MPDLHHTIAEAAAVARCSPKTVRRAIASQRLKAYRPGKSFIIAEKDLRDWIRSCAVDAPKAAAAAIRCRLSSTARELLDDLLETSPAPHRHPQHVMGTQTAAVPGASAPRPSDSVNDA